ncbi:uncharacterized protein MKK02DRAFT_30528 [Dioszegia hungarica]|uniref:Uncharacterized protein n=1 Tax=Dioszegia hungarica TaxID=4972 RepID=A0AA38H2P9_9TREE|nr:uncharacterized protein MKK02DRAFT_30528 [Dioszegia hungarica]KAI9632795.1 hypothetical protein MKK02DRAFT_30528 [Dioszegia hungarica]
MTTDECPSCIASKRFTTRQVEISPFQVRYVFRRRFRALCSVSADLPPRERSDWDRVHKLAPLHVNPPSHCIFSIAILEPNAGMSQTAPLASPTASPPPLAHDAPCPPAPRLARRVLAYPGPPVLPQYWQYQAVQGLPAASQPPLPTSQPSLPTPPASPVATGPAEMKKHKKRGGVSWSAARGRDDSKWGEQASGWGGEELVQSISRQLLGGGKEGKGWKRHALCTYTVVLTQIPASFSRSRSRVFNVELQADIVQHTELVAASPLFAQLDLIAPTAHIIHRHAHSGKSRPVGSARSSVLSMAAVAVPGASSDLAASSAPLSHAY